jgi:hypothetical protein
VLLLAYLTQFSIMILLAYLTQFTIAIAHVFNSVYYCVVAGVFNRVYHRDISLMGFMKSQKMVSGLDSKIVIFSSISTRFAHHGPDEQCTGDLQSSSVKTGRNCHVTAVNSTTTGTAKWDHAGHL